MKKQLLSTILILILSIALIGCSNGNNAADEKTSESKQPLTIGLLPAEDGIPFIIAKHNGYFEDEGVTVNIEQFKSAMDRDSALQTGNLDGVMTDMLPVVFLNDNDFKVKVTSKTDGRFKLIKSPNSDIENLDQAKGKSIGISKNTIIEYLTDRMLKTSNIESNEVEKVAIPKMPTRLEMLQNDKIDMATLPEPLASAALLSGGKVLSSSDELNINAGVMIFTQESIDTKKEEIKALYRAYNKAVNDLQNEDKENYIDLIIKEAGFPESVRDSFVLPNFTKATMASEDEFNEAIEWLKSKNLTSNDYKFEDLCDSSFIEE